MVTKPMRLLVAGGRDWTDTEAVHKALDFLHRHEGIDVVIEGDAQGVDRIAGYWARKHSVEDLKFRADWATLGRAAGPIRNQQMIEQGQPDAALLFPGGKGTADMRRRLKAAGITILEPLLPQSEEER